MLMHHVCQLLWSGDHLMDIAQQHLPGIILFKSKGFAHPVLKGSKYATQIGKAVSPAKQRDADFEGMTV